MTGPSISELISSLEPVDYNGIQSPNVVVALAPEGVTRRQAIFGKLSEDAIVIKAKGIDIPETKAKVLEIDFSAQKLKKTRLGHGSADGHGQDEQGPDPGYAASRY